MNIELKEAAEQALKELDEARKIVRASSSRQLAKDWDRRATDALATLRAAIQQAEAQQPATGEREADGLPPIVAGAVFDFAGFMTTRSEVIEVGSVAAAGPVAELVKEWAELRGLDLANAAVLSWQLHITRVSLPATGEPGVSRNPFASRCYTMSESHLSGHRLIVGFEKLGDAQDAHEWVARQGRGDFTHPAPSVPAPDEPVDNVGDRADMMASKPAEPVGVNQLRKELSDANDFIQSLADLCVKYETLLGYRKTKAPEGASELAEARDESNVNTELDLAMPDSICDHVFVLDPKSSIRICNKCGTVECKKHTYPAPSVPDDVVRDAERWRTFLATRPSNTHEVVNASIDAAMLAAKNASA